MSDYYTWLEFKNAVITALGVDGVREGDAFKAQRDVFIRQGAKRLQDTIDEYRNGHETIYQPSDLVEEGNASRGVKPPESAIRDVWLAKICDADANGNQGCTRFPVDVMSWQDRFAMVNGTIPLNDNRGKFCIDPQAYTFYVYPRVFDCWLLSMFWDGLKLDFQDHELTPFTEAAASAVSYWVKRMIKLEVDNDIAKSREYHGLFREAVPLLYVNQKEKSSVKS